MQKAVHRWLVVAAALIMTLSPQIVLAQRDDLFFADNGIIFYDPEDSGTVGGMFCGPFAGEGGSVEQQIANFFMANGFTPAQAAGMVGNAQQESSLWPLALSGTGTFWGVFQWGHARRDALDARMIEAGLGHFVENRETYRNRNSEASQAIPQETINDILRVQLEFALTEQRIFATLSPNGWIEAVRATGTVEEATEAFLIIFLGAISPAGTTKDDDLIRFWQPGLGRFYQETRQRRDFALAFAGDAHANCGLIAGGMTVSEAQAWLDATGYNDLTNDIHSRYQLPGHNASVWCGFPGHHGSRANCVGFSTYFIRAHTSLSAIHFGLGQSPGNGGPFVNNLLGVAPDVAFGTEPQPYAVFSMGRSGGLGHTGIVMGVDQERRTIVTIEASCVPTGQSGVSQLATVREFTFEQMASRMGGDVIYAYLMPFTNVGGF